MQRCCDLRMRRQIIAQLDSGGEALALPVREAIAR